MFIHCWVWDLRKYLSWIGEVYNSPLIHTKYKFKLWLFYLYFHYKVCLWWSIVPFCNKLKCIEVSNIRSLLLSDSLRIYLVYTWNMCYYDGVAFGTENLLTTKYHTLSIGHFFRQFSFTLFTVDFQGRCKKLRVLILCSYFWMSEDLFAKNMISWLLEIVKRKTDLFILLWLENDSKLLNYL